MKTIFTILLFVLIGISGYSQEGLSNEQVSKYQEMLKNAEGTYQYQIINSRKHPAILLSYIDLIEKNRLENKTNYIDLNNHLRVMILPKNIIGKPNFTPLEKFIFPTSK